jgi:MFS family permease
MAIHPTSLFIGVIASGLISGRIANHYGWRAAFWVFGGFGIVLAALTAWRLRSDRDGDLKIRPESPRFREVVAVLGRPTVRLLVVAWACMVFVNIAYHGARLCRGTAAGRGHFFFTERRALAALRRLIVSMFFSIASRYGFGPWG